MNQYLTESCWIPNWVKIISQSVQYLIDISRFIINKNWWVRYFRSRTLSALRVGRRGRRSSSSLQRAPEQPGWARVSLPPPPSLCDEEKKGGREGKKEGEQNRGGDEEKKEAFDRAVWRPCVNEPVKGSHCLAATSIWYCTLLFLLHCLQSQCLLSPSLFPLCLLKK